MSQIASDAKISSAMTALGMTAPLPNLDDSQVLKAILVALGNITSGGGGGGTGDVVGPASSTANHVAVFANGTGKLLADSGIALTAAAVGFTIAGGTSSKTLTVLNTGTAALLEVSNNFTVAGAANAPAMTLSGAIFAGGTSTTTKPLFLIEPSGLTSTGWSTDGTALGINLPLSNTPIGLDICVAGSTAFRICPNDNPVAAGAVSLFFNGTRVTWYNNFFGPRNSDATLGSSLGYWGGLGLTSGGSVKWNDDTGLARSGAGALKVTDGGAGYGTIDAGGFSASGTAGATAGPYTTITSITVKNGLVTAIAGS